MEITSFGRGFASPRKKGAPKPLNVVVVDRLFSSPEMLTWYTGKMFAHEHFDFSVPHYFLFSEHPFDSDFPIPSGRVKSMLNELQQQLANLPGNNYVAFSVNVGSGKVDPSYKHLHSNTGFLVGKEGWQGYPKIEATTGEFDTANNDKLKHDAERAKFIEAWRRRTAKALAGVIGPFPLVSVKQSQPSAEPYPLPLQAEFRVCRDVMTNELLALGGLGKTVEPRKRLFSGRAPGNAITFVSAHGLPVNDPFDVGLFLSFRGLVKRRRALFINDSARGCCLYLPPRTKNASIEEIPIIRKNADKLSQRLAPLNFMVHVVKN